MKGCLLNNMEDKAATVIKTKKLDKCEKRGSMCITKDNKGSMCHELCTAEPECDSWTQYYGTCYLKTEGAFRHQRKTADGKWISGSAYCPNKGNLIGHNLKFSYSEIISC